MTDLDAAAIEAEALERCKSELIHIPGSIQPHGVLLALYPDGTLAAHSENAGAMLGALPRIGQRFTERHLGVAARDAMRRYQATSDQAGHSITLKIHHSTFDVVMHDSQGLLIVELEKRTEFTVHPFDTQAHMAQRAMSRICAAENLQDMLHVAVAEIRRLTGFDRVVGYQFLHDDSGDVLVESKIESMESLSGLRFPASDIPPQARSLYLVNPIRLIADCNYLPVPVVPAHNGLTGSPIDMSHSVLRSVSPVHLLYLKNMGIAASMSLSVIVRGRLWGLFACHHLTARLVPHSVRMSCVVLSDIVSAMVERHISESHLRELHSFDEVKNTILAAADSAPNMLNAFDSCKDALMKVVDATGYTITLDGLCNSYGDTPAPSTILQLVEQQTLQNDEEPFVSNSLQFIPWGDPPACVCGTMAIRFNQERNGYLFWFRNEQIESVRWAGDPEKSVERGLQGYHLMPRASFAVWRQEVRGCSMPWRESEKEFAMHLKTGLQAIALKKLSDFQSVLRKLTNHQEKGKEYERTRIARDIHDDLGQNLMVLRIDLSRIAAFSELSAAVKKEIQMILGQVDSTIKSVRHIINDLRPSVLELGLKTAVEWQVEEFKKRSGIACHLHMDTDELVLEEHYATAMFRIVQESLSNIMRHAKASSVTVKIHQQDKQLSIKIDDDGIGLHTDYKTKKNTFGLAGIEQRIRNFGGVVSINSIAGTGLKIEFLVPIPQAKSSLEEDRTVISKISSSSIEDSAALHFLIYVSRAVAPMSGKSLNELLKKSRDYNRSMGITGCLIYQDGFFMQMFEGPREAVFHLYEKIKADPRHCDIGIVIEAKTRRRIFVDWSMGLRKLSPGLDEPDFNLWQHRSLSFVELAQDARACYGYITSKYIWS